LDASVLYGVPAGSFVPKTLPFSGSRKRNFFFSFFHLTYPSRFSKGCPVPVLTPPYGELLFFPCRSGLASCSPGAFSSALFFLTCLFLAFYHLFLFGHTFFPAQEVEHPSPSRPTLFFFSFLLSPPKVFSRSFRHFFSPKPRTWSPNFNFRLPPLAFGFFVLCLDGFFEYFQSFSQDPVALAVLSGIILLHPPHPHDTPLFSPFPFGFLVFLCFFAHGPF